MPISTNRYLDDLAAEQAMLNRLYPTMAASTDRMKKPEEETSEEREQKKRDFITAHYDDAKKLADRLGVTVENILGLSAHETNYAKSKFGKVNNFFNQYYDQAIAGTTGYVRADEGKKSKLAAFPDFATAAAHFEKQWGPKVQGVTDPKTFAKRLQDAGGYGIDPTTKKPDPAFSGNVAGTIASVREWIAKNRP